MQIISSKDSLSSLKLKPPAADELEICIFGSGYGEAILVHIGDGSWVSVDSCIFRNTDRPAPLLYLDTIGVNPNNSIKLIVASHWDDDHIRGISTIVREASQAKFFMSGAISDKKFDRIVLASPPIKLKRNGSAIQTGVNEFNSVYNILKGRRYKPSLAFQDKILYKHNATEVISLSPHDISVTNSIASLKSLIPSANAIGVIKPLNPNFTSVVLLIKTPLGEVLLGGDMEETSSFKGWTLLLRDSVLKSNQGDVYKVAHHGSITGHLDDVYQQLLKTSQFSLIAPWQKGGKFLPAKADLARIKKFSNEVHISAEETITAPKIDSKTARVLQRYKAKSVLINFNLIRLRKSCSTAWKVEHFGGAKKC